MTVIAACLVLCLSCTRDQGVSPIACSSACYLHLSHTRTDSNQDLDPDIERLDFGHYDMLWLGGDLAVATSKDDSTMMLIGELFDVERSTTLWSLGNHDYADTDKIMDYTNRPTYYSHHHNGITVVVLDTELNASKIVGDQ